MDKKTSYELVEPLIKKLEAYKNKTDRTEEIAEITDAIWDTLLNNYTVSELMQYGLCKHVFGKMIGPGLYMLSTIGASDLPTRDKELLFGAGIEDLIGDLYRLDKYTKREVEQKMAKKTAYELVKSQIEKLKAYKDKTECTKEITELTAGIWDTLADHYSADCLRQSGSDVLIKTDLYILDTLGISILPTLDKESLFGARIEDLISNLARLDDYTKREVEQKCHDEN